MIHSNPDETPEHTSEISHQLVPNSPPSFFSRWLIILLFVLFIVALLLAGYLYYHNSSQSIRDDKYAEIKAIADLKVDQIVTWRTERIHNGERIASDFFFRQAVEQYVLSAGMDSSQPDPSLQQGIQQTLGTTRAVYDYENVILANPSGQILLAADPIATELEANTINLVSQAIATGQVQIGDFYRCPICNNVILDIVTPIYGQDNPVSTSTSVAVLILQSDSESYLFPLIQSWPTPSQSAETLLVRKDGGEVIFLNQLRHITDPPLTFRTLLSQSDLPAARAVLGETGMFDGRDYRGVSVLADIRVIPDTPWFMVTKVDTDEILAEARYRGQITLILVIVAILLTAALGIILSNSRRVRIYRHLYQAEREQAETQQRFRATLYSIGDAVITTDPNGLVAQMNPVAEYLTGWTEPEAAGKPLDQVFQIINEDTRQKLTSQVERVLTEGFVVGLANHTLLIDRLGNERPIADSGAPIRSETGEISGVVLVFRDQSESRLSEKNLKESEGRFRKAILESPFPIMLHAEDGAVLQVSRSWCENTGYTPQELATIADWTERAYGDRRPLIQKDIDRLYGLNQRIYEGDYTIRTKSGDSRIWEFSTAPLDPLPDGSRLVISMAMDVTERRQAEAKILQLNETLEQRIAERAAELSDLYNNAPCGYHSLDSEGYYVRINDTELTWLGYSRHRDHR